MTQPIVITEAEMTAIEQLARRRMQLQVRRAIAELDRNIKFNPKTSIEL